MTRFAADPDAASGLGIGRQDHDSTDSRIPATPTPTVTNVKPPSSSPTPADIPTLSSTTPQRPKKKTIPVPTMLANKPSSYIETVQAINKRRLDWDNAGASSSYDNINSDVPETNGKNDIDNSNKNNKKSATERPQRGASSDPIRKKLLEKIYDLRADHERDPNNLLKLIELSDMLRMFDVQYHDGGTAQVEAIKSYNEAIDMALKKKEKQLEIGEETNRSLSGTADIPEEIMLDYSARSVDGILCALYTSIGKVYFMANMFEKAVESYTKALDVEPLYLDAVAARGSSRIILGKYEDASQDFTLVMERDEAGRFLDVFTGLARILQAREEAVPGGWEPMIESVNKLISTLEAQYANLNHAGGKNMIAKTLNRLLHVLFLYHDVKTKNTNAAWECISKSYKYKMSTLPEWNIGFENQKIAATKQIFTRGFWPDGVGSKTSVPIFIIGFVRSGSTLLERVLDAHPQIVGTGENSVFNGRLDSIRNKIVETSLQGDANALSSVISALADDVVDEMRQRWKMVSSGEETFAIETEPKQFVDKMLTNYYNVGFIHMLFPNALILHVVREPMDTIWSAYKHEFPAGTLDYTSDFPSLAELYHGYRDLMDHWDRELPGRVTHVRYEDMVHDMSGVAKKMINATNLEWDDSVLEFHKKKQAVNTLSTTQVRKGVYKDSLRAWSRYENHLSPLVDLLGERTIYKIKTSLHGYKPPSVTELEHQELGTKESSSTADSEQADDGEESQLKGEL